MPEFQMPLGDQQTWQCLDAFTQGYWEAAFFTSDEVADATFADVSKVAYEQALADCRTFQAHNAELLARAYACDNYGAAQAGRDFWFTTNDHGVGFWDRDQLGSLGDELSDLCVSHDTDLYVGDDGKIYFL